MTADAKAALKNVGLSRRGFLRTAGALVVGFSVAGSKSPLAAQTAPGTVAANQVDSWVAITADGTVFGYSGKCEFGQGFSVVQRQLIAEELGVPLEKVWLTFCQTGLTPDQGVTSGSQSHIAEFGPAGLRQALATAREALFQMAARRLNAPVEQLTVEDGVVMVRAERARRVSYGELVNGGRYNMTLNAAAKPKSPREYTVLGKSSPRDDIPAKVLGSYEYVQNIRLPGMLHGKVVRPPAIGAQVVSVDESSVAGLPGNVKVVVKKNFVGVVADRDWFAQQAARLLVVTWSTPPELPAFDDFYQYLRTVPSRDTLTVLNDDVDQKMGAAARTFSATYNHPYQLHGSLAASCAVADVTGGTGAAAKATIYSATQGVYPQRDSVANVLGIPRENIQVIFAEGSGCYGCNGNDTVSFDAAILSQAVGKPVRVQFSRRDEMIAGENYGPAYTIDLKAGVDGQGQIIAWTYEGWTAAKGGRPNANNPGNIFTGELAGFPVPAIVPNSNPARPTGFANNGNIASSYSAGCNPSGCGGTGTIQSERVLTHTIPSPFFTGPLRSPARLQNTFSHESFIDEVAAGLGQDPVQYRLRHLRDPRMIDVLNAAARAANWDTRPSPKPGNPRTGVVTGRGIGLVLYEGDNGYCALVVEVEVNQTTGEVRVKRMVASQDSGPISNPNGMRNQMEGGAIQGMSRALFEEVRWNSRNVTSTDWTRYQVYTYGQFHPVVETVLIDRPDEEHMGSGECTITVVAGAIGNAIFDATGARIRQVPFTPARVLAALRARP
ncbi:MAG: molybdopterin cofactor-binding domain-containing protein [Bryobacteraceae bacterium]